MKSKLHVCVFMGLLGAIMPAVRADAWDQKTVFTFSAPVEVPGQLLPAGTYVFKLADSSSDRTSCRCSTKTKIICMGPF
jgi:hypothetical protein